MSWFKEVTLETAHVKLLAISPQHKDELVLAAADGNLTELWVTAIPSASTVDDYIAKAIDDFKLDKGLAFVVIDKKTNTVIGTTRYTNAIPESRRLEIGYTWYAKSFQKTYVNSECKLLLLTHAFEVMGAIAVEFRTHWLNFQSREAIARLGAKQDGILRNHHIMPDGSYRDTVVFSIIESEWKACKGALQFKIAQIHKRFGG